MQLDSFLQRIPKIELHCHLLGTLRPDTCAELVKRSGIKLPADVHFMFERFNRLVKLDSRYAHTRVPLAEPSPEETAETWYRVLEVVDAVGPALTSREDFARLMYEGLEDAVRDSNVRYCEMFFEGMVFLANGVPYPTVVDGLIEGARAAEKDFGVQSRLIAGINRSQPPAAAMDLVDQMLAHPRDEVIGIGLEHTETLGPPENFAAVYQKAKKGGLHRTAHSGEHDPSARNIVTCLDVLECERIDHGYFVLEDPAVVARCRDEGVFFTCMSTTALRAWRPWRRRSIQLMVEQGLQVVLGADDPTMFPNSLTAEFRIAATELGFGIDKLVEICLNGVEASWMDEGEKRQRRREFESEIAALRAQLESTD
jgi:adenosine deaminase